MTDNELIARLLKWAEILNKEADMICAADRIEQLVRQRDGWEETALMYAQNVDFWKSKLAKAVEALNMVDLAIMENTNETEWRLWGEGAVSGIRTVLAELEK